MTKALQLTTILFAWTTALGGVWRHLDTGSSPQAIAFCVVCGAIALVGAWILPRFRWPGLGLIAFSLLCVGWWFVRRVLTHSEGASLRVSLILIACALEAIVLIRAISQLESKPSVKPPVVSSSTSGTTVSVRTTVEVNLDHKE